MTDTTIPRRKHALARQMRKALTPPEARLWLRIKGKPEGLHFRRQHPIGPFVVDFYCPKARLVIEVDGQVHDHPDIADRDDRRDIWLRQQGVEVLRITGRDIMADPDEAATAVIEMALGRTTK